ncbi:MAG TPA: efflux RND transporter permease subunit, partial [Pyrinomonadaceae bacterium]|nr:efflux RND transporter permease subunit [Pyrinomonadaceae bacterium]
MAHGKSDSEIIKSTHNTARFFVEKRHVSWVLLIATCAWGVYGYFSMPQRKDPETQVRVAVALVPWPGVGAERVEQLVTKKVEEQIASNASVTKIESISRTGLAIINLELDENLKDTAKALDDIKLKLDGIRDLPQGAGPINFIKDFGDTAALMLTVTSPKADATEVALRAKAVEQAIAGVRASAREKNSRFTIVLNGPRAMQPRLLRAPAEMFVAFLKEREVARDVRIIQGEGFVGFDGQSDKDDQQLLAYVEQFVGERLQASEFHPDAWPAAVVRDPAETQMKLLAVAGDKYSHREMDDYTDLIERTLKAVPQVSKVSRSGVLNEAVYLLYSQE